MATQHSTQERKTIPVIIMCDPEHPDGRLEYWTRGEVDFLRAMRRLDDAGRKEVMRVMCAIKDGRFPYTAEQIKSWTPEQCRAAVDSLPEYKA
jgi:hypothetical protein